MGGVSEAERTDEGPRGVGNAGRVVLTFLGRRMDSTWETTEYEPNRVNAYKSISSPVAYEGRWTFESVAVGTWFAYVLDTESGLGGVFGRLADPLVARLYQRQLQADLENLKELLEAQAEASASTSARQAGLARFRGRPALCGLVPPPAWPTSSRSGTRRGDICVS